MVESALPEPGHLACPVYQRGQRAELGAIVRLATFVAVAHQPGLLEDPKMLRDDRLRDPGPSRQSPDRLLYLSSQSLEESPTGRICQRPEEHILSIRHWDRYPAGY